MNHFYYYYSFGQVEVGDGLFPVLFNIVFGMVIENANETNRTVTESLGHTYYPFNTKLRTNVLDVRIARNNRSLIELHTLKKGSSDHNPVMKKKRSCKIKDWDEF